MPTAFVNLPFLWYVDDPSVKIQLENVFVTIITQPLLAGLWTPQTTTVGELTCGQIDWLPPFQRKKDVFFFIDARCYG